MEVLTFEVTPLAVNCYVVKDSGEAIVIDPGEATPPLLNSLKDSKVRMIINTHGHADHCGGNKQLVEATGAELACHEADLPLIRVVEIQGRMFGISFAASPVPTRLLKEDDIVEVGRIRFVVRHTPGHSPGHISLISEEGLISPPVAFVGDVLFAGSIGRTDFPGCSHKELIHSIRTKLLVLPDETRVYPGHGPATTIGAERYDNPFLGGS